MLNHVSIRRSGGLLCLYVVLASLVVPAHAQEQGSALEEIVVTAQKRAQSVQQVGIAITAFSGEQLQRLGATESTDIVALTPGVSFTAVAGGQTRQFSIRGVTQNDFADHTESPNAVYIDEGYIAAPQGQVFALFDLDRVEVLKGPQGTLFGRNATGGLVHYITRKPTRDLEAYTDVTYGSYNQVRFESAVGGPLSDSLSARVSVMHNSFDNIQKNIYPYGNQINALTGKAFVPSAAGHTGDGNDNQNAVRAELLWDIGAGRSLLLSAFGGIQNTSTGEQQARPTTAVLDANGHQVNTIFAANDPKGCDAISAETGACLPILFVNGKLPGPTMTAVRPAQGTDLFGYKPPASPYIVSSDMVLDNFNQYKTVGASADLSWGLSDTLTLHAISQYMHFDKRQALNTLATPTPQSDVLQTARQQTFTQEVRINGDGDRVHWVAGLYYLHIGVNYAQGLEYPPDSPISLLFFGGQPAQSPIFVNMTTNSYSAFGQVELNMTDAWSIIAGARAVKEKKNFAYDNFWYASPDDTTIVTNQTPLPIPVDAAGGGASYPSFRGNSDDNLWTGKLQLDYKPTANLLYYAGVNRGAKAGGFNAKLNDFAPATLPSAVAYRPEVLYAEEAGAKWTFLGGTSRLNGSVYHYDYKGYQAFVFSNVSGVIQNEDATYNGAELEFDTKPVKKLTLTVSASYIDAKVKSLPIAPGLVRDVRPTFTPKWELNALARLQLPGQIEGGQWAAQAGVHYQSDSYFDIRNFTADNMPAYATANAQLDWTSANGLWGASVFVDNLTDRIYKVGGFDLATFAGANDEIYGKPRWYGVRVHASTN